MSTSLRVKKKDVKKLNYMYQHTIIKAEQQLVDDVKFEKKNHLFHNETLPSFLCQLAWSHDGSFLLVPAGSYHVPASSEIVNTTSILYKKSLSKTLSEIYHMD